MKNLMINKLVESTIIITGDDKEKVAKARDVIVDGLGSAGYDETLIVNLRNRLVKVSQIGSPTTIRYLMANAYYIVRQYHLFENINDVDHALRLAEHMIDIANKKEQEENIRVFLDQYPRVKELVKEFDELLDFMAGSVIDIDGGFIINVHTDTDLDSCVRLDSEAHPELNFKLNYVDFNKGKFTKWYKAGVEVEPVYGKVIRISDRKVPFKDEK